MRSFKPSYTHKSSKKIRRRFASRSIKPGQKVSIGKKMVIRSAAGIEFEGIFYRDGKKEITKDTMGYASVIKDLMRDGYIELKKRGAKQKKRACKKITVTPQQRSFHDLVDIVKFFNENGIQASLTDIKVLSNSRRKIEHGWRKSS